MIFLFNKILISFSDVLFQVTFLKDFLNFINLNIK